MTTMTYQPVEVTVKPLEEDGEVSLNVIQPKEGVTITASLDDPDGVEPITKWQWATSSSATGPWNDIDPTDDTANMLDGNDMTYQPRESDRGLFLRATVTYTDEHGEDDPFTDGVDESIEMASGVTDNPVLMADYRNTKPIFPDQDPDTADLETAQEREISEDADAGDSVGAPVVASDIGADGMEETLFYTLSDDTSVSPANDDNFFIIDSGTGQISVDVDEMLDFETQEEFKVVVTATDPGNEPESVNVTIKVLNVDESPVIEEPTQTAGFTSKTMPEHPHAIFIRLISSYTATDEEDSTGSSLRWSLSGPDSSRFELDMNEGSTVALSLKADADYENLGDSGNNKDYQVRLTVRDMGNNTDSRDVTVEITNEEEIGAIAILNRQPQAGTALRATASDPDRVQGGIDWTWATSASSDAESGTWIDIPSANSSSYTPRDSDAAPGNVYLRVTATYVDGKGTDTDRLRIASEYTVKARDDDNDPPRFTDRNPTHTLNEGPARSSNLFLSTLPITEDDDSGNRDVLTFTKSGTDEEFFVISENGDDLDVSLIANTLLDHEAKATYTFRITATDPSNSSDTVTYTLKVDDVDELPTLDTTAIALDYHENSTDPVRTLEARDPEGSQLQWTLTGTHRNAFTIDGGILKFKSSPDFENPTYVDDSNMVLRVSGGHYLVTVEASDGRTGGGITQPSVDITVTIGNVEEPGEVTLTKSQPKVGVAITAVIEDPDSTSLSETWQWATSTSPTGPWYDIALDGTVTENSQNATYKPRESDVGYYLQATASYSDGTDDPNKAMDETQDSKGAVSANRVIRADYMNQPPEFRDHDTIESRHPDAAEEGKGRRGSWRSHWRPCNCHGRRC